MSTRSADIIWWNGTLVPWDTAKVHVTSETALRGLNVFEGLRAYWRPNERAYAVVGLDAHLDRLVESARILQIPFSSIRQRIRSGLQALLCNIANPSDLYLRPTLYIDQGGYQPDPDKVIVGEFISWRREPARTSRSLNCGISSWMRMPASCLPPQAKVGATYTAFRMARLEASLSGHDEAILLNEQGHVTETAGGAIFVACPDALATPPLSAGILASITRKIVMEVLCPHLGHEIQERTLDASDLRFANSAFIAGTLDEISNVVSVDGRVLDKMRGSRDIPAEMANLYRAFCDGEKFEGTDWIEMIYLTKSNQ